MNKELYIMLETMALAEIAKAKMSLHLLGEKSVGIGDHSTADFYNNADEALAKLAEAEDKLQCLEKNYTQKVKL
jgi:hypothetical protein